MTASRGLSRRRIRRRPLERLRRGLFAARRRERRRSRRGGLFAARRRAERRRRRLGGLSATRARYRLVGREKRRRATPRRPRFLNHPRALRRAAERRRRGATRRRELLGPERRRLTRRRDFVRAILGTLLALAGGLRTFPARPPRGGFTNASTPSMKFPLYFLSQSPATFLPSRGMMSAFPPEAARSGTERFPPPSSPHLCRYKVPAPFFDPFGGR